MKGLTPLLLFIIFSFSQIIAQENPAIDSLQKIITNTSDEKLKADALVELALEYISFDSKQAYEYAKQSISLSKK